MSAPGLPTRRLRRLVSSIAIFAALFFLTQQYLGLELRTARLSSGSLSSGSSYSLCATHGYSPFRERADGKKRKVYDLMMVNTELDFLEIRLNTLYDQVDYFVIVESPKTFQMGAKDMLVKQNWHKFEKYHDKMIYHQLKIPEGFRPPRPWDVEDLQRDAMFDQVLPYLTGGQAPVYGDAILVSDVDEIPRPETVQVLRSCNYPLRLTLNSRFYYYSFQFLHSGPEWPHPQATTYRGNYGTIRPTNLRNGDGGIPFLREFQKGVLENSSWHCSSCFSTISEFLNKMASFSHVWMNGEEYRNPNKIANAVKNGQDLWGRKQEIFERIEHNKDLPSILVDEGERFPWLVNRDRADAGFTDYKPSS